MRTTAREILACGAMGVVVACAAPRSERIGRVGVPPLVEHVARELELDVEHYALSLELDPATRELRGTCTLRAWPMRDLLRVVKLDFADLRVDSVRDARGDELAFRHVGDELCIELSQPSEVGRALEITVEYSGKPTHGLWFVGERDGVPTQVYTQGECEDARGWFPCVDDPAERATSELSVTLPRGWTSLAAGELVDRRDLTDGRAREHWRMATPHATYLTTLVAGEFARVEDRWSNVALTYAGAPRFEGELEPTFSETPQMLEFFGELTGVRYPFAKYSQACVDNFLMGGMENISATTLTDALLTDELGRRDYDPNGLIAHELAHQWFGDLVTCREWPHIWLNEGFATYLPLLYFEATRGTDAFREGVRAMQREYLATDLGAARRPTVWRRYREPLDLFFDGHAYPGAGSRLHYLRFVVGDAAFAAGLQRYVRDNAGRGVVTDDFESAMELASGVELDDFFAQWLESAGYPEFAVAWSWSESARVVRIRVQQMQSPAGGTPSVFRGPAQIEVRAGGESRRVRVDVAQRAETFELACDVEPEWVVFDEHGWWPARIAHERSRDEWLALLAGDDDPNSRADAATALARDLGAAFSEAERWRVAEALLGALGDDAYTVRAAAARAFAAVNGPADHPIARALKEVAANDRSSAVRIAALEALTRWGPDASLAAFAREQFEARFSYATMCAAAALALVNEPDSAREWLVSKLEMPSPHDSLRAGLLNVLSSQPGDAVTDELRRRALDENAASPSREIAVRNLALRAKHRADVRDELIALLASTRRYRLQSALIEALAQFDDAHARRALENYYPRAADPRQRRAIERALLTAGR